MRCAGVLEEREEALQEADLWRRALEVEVDDPPPRDVPRPILIGVLEVIVVDLDGLCGQGHLLLGRQREAVAATWSAHKLDASLTGGVPDLVGYGSLDGLPEVALGGLVDDDLALERGGLEVRFGLLRRLQRRLNRPLSATHRFVLQGGFEVEVVVDRSHDHKESQDGEESD